MTDLSATTGVTDRPSGTGAKLPGTGVAESVVSERIRGYLDQAAHRTPCLALDLSEVRRRYTTLHSAFPTARICYAVKANPAPEVVRELVDLGASFDVASPGEIDLCLREGAAPESISYGNTIKKPADIAHAYRRGVRLFATDSEPDLHNIAAHAPGSRVFCRIMVDDKGSRTPFGRKFGCAPDTAVNLLLRAAELGLEPIGVSFHSGSQQLVTDAWEHGIAAARGVFDTLAKCGVNATTVNLGGGLPGTYTEGAPPLGEYVTGIERALDEHFPRQRPDLLLEPGRYIVADAGVLRSEVVLVTPGTDGRRWVYLDIGRYNGLAETEGEAITYRLRTSRDGDEVGPVVLAGPTCDGDDVLYQHTTYELPLGLRGGDHVDVLSAGAYTASYSAVGFNGFAPLPTHCFRGERRSERR